MHSQYLLPLLATALLSDALVLQTSKRDDNQPCPLKDGTTSFLFGGNDDEVSLRQLAPISPSLTRAIAVDRQVSRPSLLHEGLRRKLRADGDQK